MRTKLWWKNGAQSVFFQKKGHMFSYWERQIRHHLSEKLNDLRIFFISPDELNQCYFLSFLFVKSYNYYLWFVLYVFYDWMCCFKCPLCVKYYISNHIPTLAGPFSQFSWTDLMCYAKCEHLCGFFPLWTDSICIFKLPFWEKL